MQYQTPDPGLSLRDGVGVNRRTDNSKIPGQCPECGAAAVLPIMYGFPAPEMEGAATRGEIVLGGCLISEEAPIWHCTRCGVEGGSEAGGMKGSDICDPFADDVRSFVEATPWRFASTYAATWPHEYVVRNAENAPMILALARHIFEHGVDGRFYSQVRKYHHEGGKVYWSMAATPEGATLINRCDEAQTYEVRLSADTLPKR